MRFDASLCNMLESRKERPVPVAVDEFPRDVFMPVRAFAAS